MKHHQLFVLLACVCTSACGRGTETPPPTPDPETAKAATTKPATPSELQIEEGMMRDLRIITGRVESRQGDEEATLLGELAVDERTYAEVGVPVSARVVRLLVGAGENVREGQPLMELQSTEVGRARSEYLTAAAQATFAEEVLKRKRELAAERIAPQREVQEAESQAAAARSAVQAASAALAAMGLTLPGGPSEASGSSTFSVAAPVGGTVIERTAMRGQTIEPGTPAFRIANLSTLWLVVHAFERDAVRIRNGARARVVFSALPGEEFPGTVSLVGREVSSESRTVDVRIDVQNKGEMLRPGMSASSAVPVSAGSAPILAIPVAAVQRVGEDWCVFVPKRPDLFEIRKIGRGRDLGTEVEVLSGLQVGEVVVVDGAFLLKSQAEKRDAGHDAH